MSIRNNFINQTLATVLESLSSMKNFAKKAVEIFCNEQNLEHGQSLLRELLGSAPKRNHLPFLYDEEEALLDFIFAASRGTPGDYTAGLEYSKEYLEKLDDTIETFSNFLSQVEIEDSLADNEDSVIEITLTCTAKAFVDLISYVDGKNVNEDSKITHVID